MTIKEIIKTYTYNDIVNKLNDIDYLLCYEDVVLFRRVYEVLSMSTGISRKESIAFIRAGNHPFAVMMDEKGEANHLVAIMSSIVNCEIYDDEGVLSDLEMLIYIIMHYMALETGEKPYVFLDMRRKELYE